MLSKTLIRNQASVGTGIYGTGAAGDAPPLRVSDADYFQGTVQVSVTTATVTLFGRAAPTLPWIQVAAPMTVSGLVTVPVLSEMYAAVTAWTAGAVDVALNYPCNS